ncbi:hypothetical protein BpHYR1_032269 [Brachionus plicatilis]|uniref:Uncharacterized protein n=1 Tax=Brachionus plicatilis TaxID=10195 RepID=A0A3M7SPC4_BRAPC|nr:hypothetical protein BpHYR1_032269 [Brachionus plicatilis]
MFCQFNNYEKLREIIVLEKIIDTFFDLTYYINPAISKCTLQSAHHRNDAILKISMFKGISTKHKNVRRKNSAGTILQNDSCLISYFLLLYINFNI